MPNLAQKLRESAEFLEDRCEDGDVIAADIREIATELERLQDKVNSLETENKRLLANRERPTDAQRD